MVVDLAWPRWVAVVFVGCVSWVGKGVVVAAAVVVVPCPVVLLRVPGVVEFVVVLRYYAWLGVESAASVVRVGRVVRTVVVVVVQVVRPWLVPVRRVLPQRSLLGWVPVGVADRGRIFARFCLLLSRCLLILLGCPLCCPL